MAPPPDSFSSEEEYEYEYMSDDEAEEQQQDRKNTYKAIREEEEEEEEESEEDDEGEETPPISPRDLDKRSSVQKPNPIRTDEGSDSESDFQKTQNSPTASNFTIKPIVSNPIVDPPKPNKSASKPAVKRPAETEQYGMDSRTKKKRVSNGEEENGAIEEKKSAFSRLWSEDDEIVILKGMIDYKSNKGADPYADMGAFHEFIKKSLHVDVSKNQLTDKIKRLKKKYRNNAEKAENPVFSKPHEQKSFELSKKIWGLDDNPKSTNRKATKSNHSLNLLKEERHELALQKAMKESNSVMKAVQEDFLSMYPRMKESLESKNGLYLSLSESGRNFLNERMSLIGSAMAEKLEEKWNNLQVDEIELYLKRVELIREQTKLVLDEMKSSRS